MNNLSNLTPGDSLLIASKPGQGKTRLALQLALQAARDGHRAVFFTAVYTPDEANNLLSTLNAQPSTLPQVEVRSTKTLTLAAIIETLKDAPRGTLTVVDYLQILLEDPATRQPDATFEALHTLARERGVILVFISQVEIETPTPVVKGPVDLSLFSKTWFLQEGQIECRAPV